MHLVIFCFFLSSIRNLGEFPKILAIAVDSLLCSCDDQESDVRLVAGESLNKLIKVRYMYMYTIAFIKTCNPEPYWVIYNFNRD